jgi:hypothetical protein
MEQYAIAWTYATYAMDIAAEAYMSNGQVQPSDVESCLRQTWLGERDVDGKPSDLVTLLMAPLRAYCLFYAAELEGDAQVLIIDSLVLRFEELFRKLARRLGVPDWIPRQVGDAVVDQVVGLPDLLDNERIINFLGPDLHAFAKFTLLGTDEGLRHRVAHAATHMSDYNAKNLNALVLLALRLAMRGWGKTQTPRSGNGTR